MHVAQTAATVLQIRFEEERDLTGRTVTLRVHEPVTRRALLDALEAAYPMLGGTIRDRKTGKRRDFIRFFACEQDLSLEPDDVRLPEAVVSGSEPFMVVGAMAGG